MKLSTVILASDRWSDGRLKWSRAQRLGFHAAYTYDHLSWRSFRETTWMSMVPVLAAAAGETTTLRLGPLVTSPNFRHPLLLAKDLIAIDDISEGRLVVGIGAGGGGFDATVLGNAQWSVSERHDRFKEFTTTVVQLLSEPTSTIEGRYYPILESRQYPGPVQRPHPPIYVSALGVKGITFAAQVGDGWVSVGGLSHQHLATEDAVRLQSRRLDDALESEGRERAPFARLYLDGFGDESPLASYEHFLDFAGRFRDMKFTELVIHMPIAESLFDYDEAVFERIATEGHEVLKSWS